MTDDITLSITPDINFSAFSRTESSQNLSLSGVEPGYSATEMDLRSPKAEEYDERSSSSDGNSSYFDKLPDELTLHVFEYLDPMSLIKVGMVDKRFQELTNDMSVWDKVSFGASWKPRPAVNAASFRTSYKQFYLDEKAAERRRKQQQRDQRLRRRKKKFSHIMLRTLYNKLGEWLCFLSCFTFTILCALKLDDVILAPWPAVMIPLYIFCFILFINPAMLCAFSCATDYYDFSDELKEGRKCYSPAFFVPLINYPFKGTREERVIPFWLFLIQFFLFVILMSVKLAGSTMSWFAALWPVISLAVSTIACMGLCNFRCWRRENNVAERLLVVPLMIAIIVTAIFVALQLDETVCWSWHVVFAPAYATLLFCGVSLLLGFCRRDDNCLYTHDWVKYSYLIFAVVFMIPATVFLPLLATSLNGTFDARFVTVFAPIWVFDVLCFAGSIFVDILAD